MARYYLEYDIEYADGTTGHGSHGDYGTYREALDAKKELRDRKYTAEELEYAPMYTNISVEQDEDYDDPYEEGLDPLERISQQLGGEPEEDYKSCNCEDYPCCGH